MFFVRFFVLLFFVALALSSDDGGARQLNGFGYFVTYFFFVAAPALYMLPTYEAWKRAHPNVTAIAMLNLFLGWTFLGWIVAVVWAHKKTEVVLAATYIPPKGSSKKCPFCAEEVRAEAIKCKHCGSDLLVR